MMDGWMDLDGLGGRVYSGFGWLVGWINKWVNCGVDDWQIG